MSNTNLFEVREHVGLGFWTTVKVGTLEECLFFAKEFIRFATQTCISALQTGEVVANWVGEVLEYSADGFDLEGAA